ncbi:MAG TPA: hypothetical protein VHW01_07670 [Polyangiaceae bacterium]|jgi:hypothetical protein|nr:hypothetical protein [Polyangiaceae bacterium]
MSDPKRLLTSSDVDPAVLKLVESLRGIGPDDGISLASWPAMAAKVAALPVAVAPPSLAPAPPAPALAGVSKVLGLKLLGVALASTAVGAGVLWVRPKPHAPTVSASAAANLAVPVVASKDAPQAAAIDSALPAATPEKAGAASAVSGVPLPRSSRLDAEASLLTKVRNELRSGDPHGALATLNQLQSTLPNGGLMQEREVLSVEVLAESGNLSAAQRKASAFIAAHPKSPYSAKLQRFVQAQ